MPFNPNPAFTIEGVRVTRLEDLRLITGRGRFAADWNAPGQLHGHFLRADRAHARIVELDVAAARRHPGVHAVITGEDAVRAGYVQPVSFFTFEGKDGQRAKIPQRPVLAHQRVRFVGEPVALVVADSEDIARDACALIAIRYEDLPCVIDPAAAFAPTAAQLHEGIPRNQAFECEAGDAAAVAAAFARAAHVTRLTLDSQRVVPSPMEPRACLIAYDAAADRYHINSCVQGVNMLRMQLAGYTGLAEDKFHIIAQDVGGGFGSRSMGYPEYCALMLAARATGRPVKWVSTRTEALLSDTHGRGSVIEGELALDAEGKFLALRLNWIAEVGAYMTPPGAAATIRSPIICFTGAYRIPALYGNFRVCFTNAAPIGNYRGAGRPDIAYVVERLVSRAAVEMNLDPIAIRQRNWIPREAFPYTSPMDSTYEIADFAGLVQEALPAAQWDSYAQRAAASRAAGKLRGRGICTVIENTSAGAVDKDQIAMRVNSDGTVTVHSVAHAQGQGHETTLAMVTAQALGIAPERIIVRQGVNDPPLIGNHTGGSRNTVGNGGVCHVTALKLIEQAKRVVAEQWSVEPSQIDYAAGVFLCNEPARTMALSELAARQRLSLVGEALYGSTWPNGCHIAEVEIDPDTGFVDVVSYVAVDDFGTVVHEPIVEGQVHGAVLQGAGQVFGEHAYYDRRSGQMLTASFMDYFMPRANLIREMTLLHHPTPSSVSPLGVKGAGEAGVAAALPALVDAVLDALRPLGVTHLNMPLTPAKVWAAIHNNKPSGNAG